MTNTTNELVFYQQGAAAGQQVDKYSMQPGCVDSENLDIFSDSQAIKGMPWSEKEVPQGGSWVDVDVKERFYLADDGRVWDSKTDTWYNHQFFDDNANNVDYLDGEGSNKAVFGIPRKLYVAYSGDDWKTISILTDRLIYNIYSDWIHITAGPITNIIDSKPCYRDGGDEPYGMYISKLLEHSTSTKYNAVTYHNRELGQTWEESEVAFLDCPGGFNSSAANDEVFMRAKLTFSNTGDFMNINVKAYQANLKWSEDQEDFVYDSVGSLTTDQTIASLPMNQSADTTDFMLDNTVEDSSKVGVVVYASTQHNANCDLRVAFYKKEDWSYLYPGRNVIEIDDEIYVQYNETKYAQLTFEALTDEDSHVYYQLMQTNVINLPDGYEIVAFARGFDYQYIFVNKDDFGIVYYATDIRLATWDAGWKFSGTKFINAMMIGNYVYVLAEKRGVRGLYIFSNGDMKLLVGANNRYTEDLDLINGKEIFNFTGIMANWRDKVVCATKDSVFMRGLTKLGNNAGAFILKVDGEITDIQSKRGYLDVYFTEPGSETIYRKTIQDDVNIKSYESEFSVTYPVQINSHLIEKEPLSLAISYNLPNASTKLEAYISVNDNYFWSFLTDGNTTPTEGDKFKVSGLSGDYWLNFVEKKGNWLTFSLSGYLPYQTSNTKNLVSEDTLTTIAFTDFNHFKYLGEVKKLDPEEIDGKHTYLNLTTKNDLPIVRKAQVKLVGITDTHVTPEIYGIRLLSEQFNK